MCGLFGVLSVAPLQNIETVRSIAAVQSYRGPDEYGEYLSPCGRLMLTHRRLEIIGGTAGRQPFITSDRRFALVFNGEIYNQSELLAAYGGTKFRICNDLMKSDTALVGELLKVMPVDEVIRSLRGMFAMAVVDLETLAITLARDYYGEKPLYYYSSKDILVFSSECESIRLLTGRVRLSSSALNYYLHTSTTPRDQSIYADIYKCEPGSVMNCTIRAGKIETLIRHKIEPRIESGEDPTLGLALNTYMDQASSTDYEAGVMLSGGLDSTLVACNMRKRITGLRAYTYDSGDFRTNEYNAAKLLADELKIPLIKVRGGSTRDWEDLNTITQEMPEPFGVGSILPFFQISKEARKEVKVLYSGDGGDETYFGYNRHRLGSALYAIQRNIPLFIRRFVVSAIGGFLERPNHVESLPAFLSMLARNLAQSRPDSLYDFYFQLRSVDKSGIIGTKITDEMTNKKNKYANFDNLTLRDLDLEYFLSEECFPKADIGGMLNGIEVRCPLISPELVKIASKSIGRGKTFGSKREFILSEIRKTLPEYRGYSHKIGFNYDTHNLMRKKFDRFMFEEVLSNITGVLRVDSSRLRHAYREMQDGGTAKDRVMWNLFVLSLWLREH